MVLDYNYSDNGSYDKNLMILLVIRVIDVNDNDYNDWGQVGRPLREQPWHGYPK